MAFSATTSPHLTVVFLHFTDIKNNHVQSLSLRPVISQILVNILELFCVSLDKIIDQRGKMFMNGALSILLDWQQKYSNKMKYLKSCFSVLILVVSINMKFSAVILEDLTALIFESSFTSLSIYRSIQCVSCRLLAHGIS